MKTELAPTSSDLSLLPRADLPVIWDGFAAKAEQLRTTAETLTVTTIEQKAEMELARTTRLTLKQIRVEVEKKRVELGEGHLTEIQKINGAAKKIKEMIEPLEARLLHQEQFAERAEADRVLELTKRRNDEVRAIWPGCPGDFGRMPDAEYAALIARLRAEAALMAEEKRRQAEAVAEEKRLRDEQAQAFLAQQAEAQRQARVAAAEANARLAAEVAERRRQEQELIARLAKQQAEAEAKLAEQAKELRAAVAEAEAKLAEERAEAEEKFRQEQAEKDRLRDEELKAVEAKRLELEVQLANERAAKLAEAEAARKLALAPDVEKLRDFAGRIQGTKCPPVTSDEAQVVVGEVSRKFDGIVQLLNAFCRE